MVAPGGVWGAWLLPGGVCGCSRGACMVAPGGVCMVAPGGVCMVAPGGACVVAPGGVCVVALGGRAWFFR